jgi:hypothetical protein
LGVNYLVVVAGSLDPVFVTGVQNYTILTGQFAENA